jgi:formate/nitrite transporter
MMTLVTGGELFTGNTALVTAAVIEKKAAFKDLLKNWFFSYGGNFVGSLLMAYLVFNGKTLGVGAAAVNLTNMKLSAGFQTLFIRGVLCNWLVCMAVYMASGCTSLISKMVAIWFPISAFVALGLEHSIANMFIIPLGMMLGAPVTTNEFLMKNLLPVTLGNIVGGAVCVATAFSATYGSLLEKKPDASKVMGIRGGFTPSSKIVRASMDLNMMSVVEKPERKEFVSMVPNSEKSFAFMTPDARERGAVGNQIEKVKTKKDPATTWSDIHEYAAAIRAGSTNW